MKGHFKTSSQLERFGRVGCSPKGGHPVYGELQEHGCKKCNTNALRAKVVEESDRS